MVRSEAGGFAVIVDGVHFGPYWTLDEAATIDAYLSGGASSQAPTCDEAPGIVGGEWQCIGGHWQRATNVQPGVNLPPANYVPPAVSNPPAAAPAGGAGGAGPAPIVLPNAVDALAGRLGVTRGELAAGAAVAALVLLL